MNFLLQQDAVARWWRSSPIETQIVLRTVSARWRRHMKGCGLISIRMTQSGTVPWNQEQLILVCFIYWEQAPPRRYFPQRSRVVMLRELLCVWIARKSLRRIRYSGSALHAALFPFQPLCGLCQALINPRNAPLRIWLKPVRSWIRHTHTRTWRCVCARLRQRSWRQCLTELWWGSWFPSPHPESQWESLYSKLFAQANFFKFSISCITFRESVKFAAFAFSAVVLFFLVENIHYDFCFCGVP